MTEQDELITIKDAKTGAVLASARRSQGVTFFEGAWYFERDQVNLTHLRISKRTYTCPYKGVCYWIDMEAPTHQVRDIGFTYFDTKKGYEFIENKIGFLSGKREHTVEEATLIEENS